MPHRERLPLHSATQQQKVAKVWEVLARVSRRAAADMVGDAVRIRAYINTHNQKRIGPGIETCNTACQTDLAQVRLL